MVERWLGRDESIKSVEMVQFGGARMNFLYGAYSYPLATPASGHV
jgi:hypothetical protein